MKEIQVFNNPEFGEIRTVAIDGEPWMVGKDVAQALGYSNPRKALADHVDNEDKHGVTIRDAIGRDQEAIGINESGLYSLVLSSKLPGAKKFKRWVTSEVLPIIRKNGGYIAGQSEMSETELMAKAVLVAQKTLEDRDRKIKELTDETEIMRPKELFADSVAASDSSILVGELAKILRQNGLDIGQKRLFERLRNEGFLIRGNNRSDRNMPTQRSMDAGLFVIKETVINHSDGRPTVQKTVKVTGKGQQYFINRYLGDQVES